MIHLIALKFSVNVPWAEQCYYLRSATKASPGMAARPHSSMETRAEPGEHSAAADLVRAQQRAGEVQHQKQTNNKSKNKHSSRLALLSLWKPIVHVIHIPFLLSLLLCVYLNRARTSSIPGIRTSHYKCALFSILLRSESSVADHFLSPQSKEVWEIYENQRYVEEAVDCGYSNQILDQDISSQHQFWPQHMQFWCLIMKRASDPSIPHSQAASTVKLEWNHHCRND